MAEIELVHALISHVACPKCHRHQFIVPKDYLTEVHSPKNFNKMKPKERAAEVKRMEARRRQVAEYRKDVERKLLCEFCDTDAGEATKIRVSPVGAY